MSLPDWSSLPDVAVFEIATRLNRIEFINFSCVCKPWRSICTANKAQINASKPPLLLELRNNYNFKGNTTCHAFSFDHRKRYYKTLHSRRYNIRSFSHEGKMSHGYFVCYSSSNIGNLLLFINPLTGHEFHILIPEQRIDVALLTSPPQSPDCLVVAIAYTGTMVYRSLHGREWTTCMLPIPSYSLQHVVFYKGRVCYLANNSAYIVKLGPQPEIELPPFRFRYPRGRGKLRFSNFAVGDDGLFVVEIVRYNTVTKLSKVDKVKLKRVYRLGNLEEGKWERVYDFDRRALFLSNYNGYIPNVGHASYEDDPEFHMYFPRASLCSN